MSELLYWALSAGLWFLILARYLGEAFYLYPFFSSPLAVCGLALMGMAAGWAIRHTILSRSNQAGNWVALLLSLPYLLTPQPDLLMGSVLLTGGVFLTLFITSKFIKKYSALLLAVIVFALYLRTMGRTVGEADTFEFQVVAPALGVAHPTGYPLYILLGKSFSLLPMGTVAWRVNLTSAVFVTGAVLLLYRLLGHSWWTPSQGGDLITPNGVKRKAGCVEIGWIRPVAFLSALALAFSRVLWSQAVVAEVYGLNLLFFAGALTLTVEILQGQKGPRTIWGLTFLLGLSLTNHLTVLLFFPAVGLALLLSRPRLNWREWLVSLGLFLLGLSLYAYIPLRWPALHNGQQMGMEKFLAYVTGQQFSGALQFHLLQDPNRYAILGRLLLEPFGWVGLLLAAIGLSWAITRHLRLALVSILAFLAYALYGLVYQVPDISVFLLPAHLLLAFWIGLGAIVLTWVTCRLRPWAYNISLALFALLPLSRIWMNLPVVDQSGRTEAEQWGRYVMSLPLAPDAAVLADGEKFSPLYYLQKVEGVRPDLDLAVHFTEEEYWADLMARLTAGQTVYLARYLPHLEEFYLRSVGPLVEIGTKPLIELPAEVKPVEVRFGSEVELVAFKLDSDPQNRPLFHLTLYWRAEATPQNDLEVRLRLVDEAGEVHWVSNGIRPVDDLYPTNGWPPNILIADYHPLPLSPWLTPGRYQLEVGLFPRFSEQGLLVEGGTGVWEPLSQVVIDRPVPGKSLPYEVRILLGTAWLVGYDLPTAVPAGSPVTMDLAWAHVKEAGIIRIEWVDEAGQVVGGQEIAAAEKTEQSRVLLTAPRIPGMYRILVGWKDRIAWCRWLAHPTSRCVLSTVRVTPAREGLANFGGKILLVAAELGAAQLRAGESLPVTLYWRPLRAIAENYTITVQLLGPDGRLHGQVDAWPVQGTMPTSRWIPGQEITDSYQVALLPGSPPGHYQVIVGIYLLATMERLPVIDQYGNPVGDHWVVGKIEVGD